MLEAHPMLVPLTTYARTPPPLTSYALPSHPMLVASQRQERQERQERKERKERKEANVAPYFDASSNSNTLDLELKLILPCLVSLVTFFCLCLKQI